MITIKELIIKGYTILLDDEDYEKISKMSGWYIVDSKKRNSRTSYVTHTTFGFLHRYILGVTDPNICVDHIDRNGLNNQKSNLRLTDTHLNKRNQNTCSRNRFNFNGIGYEPKRGTHSARIRASWCEDEYDPVKKRYKTRNKSFSLSEYSFNEALRLAVLTRIQKMRKFDYIIDERSETIERKCLEENPNMEEILGISFKDFE